MRRLEALLACAALLLPGCGSALRAPTEAVADAQDFRRRVPVAGPTPDVSQPNADELPLANGFRVLAVPWDSGTVALEVRCRSGSHGDPEGRSGVTSLLARMFTEGTDTTSALEQAVLFEDLGTGLGHDAAADSLGLSTEIRPEDLEVAIQLLADALLRPGLRETDFERVRSERLDDLKATRQDPGRVAWLIAVRAVFGPVRGRPTSGSPKDVQALEVAHLRARYEEAVTPSRCALLAAGSYDATRLQASVLASFASWKGAVASAEVPPPGTSSHGGEVLFLERPDAVQSAVVMGRLVPGRLDPSFEARELVDTAFGGLFTSRLNSNLRERHGFTYGAFSSLAVQRDQGAWFLSSNVHGETTARAVAEMGREVARLSSEPLAKDEVKRATADLIQERRSRLEHNTSLLASVREPFVYDLHLTHEVGYAERLSALTPDALEGAASSLLVGPLVTVVVAAPDQANELRRGGFSVVAADPTWLQ